MTHPSIWENQELKPPTTRMERQQKQRSRNERNENENNSTKAHETKGLSLNK